MLHLLFQQQKQYLEYFFEQLDITQAEQILEKLYHCSGLIFFAGVGKSGIVAEKLAMTFVSLGTKALYLSPQNLLHGDIGIVSSQDVVIFISKSGETKELLSIVHYIKQRRALTMAWVSQESSSLAGICDMTLILPLERELCPFNLAPTTSTEVQMIFGDVLAIALMKKKAFTLEAYAKNHPAGSIGKSITSTVEDVMITGQKLPLCRLEDKLKDVLVELSNKRCGCLLVIDDRQKIHGIFTDGDLRRALQSNSSQILEEMMVNLMTKKFLSIEKHYPIYEAAKVMQKDSNKWVSVLPVVQEEQLIGLIRMHDVVSSNF